jgi:hypothetical protein
LNRKNILRIESEEKTYFLLLKDDENIREELIWYKEKQLPIDKGQVLGECNIYLGNILLDTIYLTSTSDADIWNLKEILALILCQFFTFSL